MLNGTTFALTNTAADQNYASFVVQPWQWAAFIGLVAALLVADLLLVHRTAHVITLKEAGIESAIWITIGVAFTGVIFWWHGDQAAGEYISGYLIEKSLSVDNVFVWAVIFSYFAVPPKYQFRTLFWGVFGALDPAGDLHLRRGGAHPAVRGDARPVRGRPVVLGLEDRVP